MPAVIQPWLQLPQSLCCWQPLPSEGAVSVPPEAAEEEEEEEEEEEAEEAVLLALALALPPSGLQKPQVARQ